MNTEGENMEQQWSYVIKPKTKWYDFKLKELWNYRDLVWLFVKRDFTTRYKQTILGPAWFIVQPLLIAAMQAFVFHDIANIDMPAEGVSHFLFYMISNVPWLYFSNCLTTTSGTFVDNVNLYGKVYFPRLALPISTVITSMINFFVQLLLVGFFSIIFLWRGSNARVTWVAALTPFFLLEMALLGLGFGIIISSLTTKYRDLRVVVTFGISLWMYATPVIYAASFLWDQPYLYRLIMLNPLSPIVELMRYGWIGVGSQPWLWWGISWLTTFVVLFIGITMFNRVEKTFMDTV